MKNLYQQTHFDFPMTTINVFMYKLLKYWQN